VPVIHDLIVEDDRGPRLVHPELSAFEPFKQVTKSVTAKPPFPYWSPSGRHAQPPPRDDDVPSLAARSFAAGQSRDRDAGAVAAGRAEAECWRRGYGQFSRTARPIRMESSCAGQVT